MDYKSLELPLKQILNLLVPRDKLFCAVEGHIPLHFHIDFNFWVLCQAEHDLLLFDYLGLTSQILLLS